MSATKLAVDEAGPAVVSVPAPALKSVWGVPLQSEQHIPTLNEVMSEQLANELHDKEEKTELQRVLAQLDDDDDNILAEDPADLKFDVDDPDCADDLLIAQMLQLQFDKEYDEALEKEVQHVNGSSKVKICYSKYKIIPPASIWDEDSDDDVEEGARCVDDGNRDVDSYETADKEVGAIPRCGYKKVGDTIVTKHDQEISERSNGRRIMEFPPGIQTGDGAALNAPQIHVSNAVYNKIRNFSIKEGKRKNRVHDKIDKSTSDQAVDAPTRLLLFKMINNGFVETVHGIISTGKEAVILHADGGPGPDTGEVPLNIPKEVAIKVFKTTLNEFKNRDKYIRDDYRFKNRFSKQNPRKVIHMWAEKEMHNLLKMSKFGLPVPEVILLRKHILIMTFIGHDGVPAPKLKHSDLSEEELQLAYDQTVSMMIKLYNEVHLVHADLSEFNILWHEGQCWFIDVSQSVEPNHPHGLEFLYHDCKNVSNFFRGRGLQNCLSPVALFSTITGFNLEEKETESEILSQVEHLIKSEKILAGAEVEETEAKIDPFEYCWEHSKSPAARTPSRPIPGHARPKPNSIGSSGKSPRSPKSGKSPRTPPPTALSSSPSLAGISAEDLKRLKEDLLAAAASASSATDETDSTFASEARLRENRESQVKFKLDDDDDASSDEN